MSKQGKSAEPALEQAAEPNTTDRQEQLPKPEPIEISPPDEIELGVAGGVIPQSPAAAYRLGFAHGQLAGSASATKIPNLDSQLANFKTWQSHRGEPWVWSDQSMAALRSKLFERDDAIELLPCFAMTVGVRLRSGRVIYLDRQGRETT